MQFNPSDILVNFDTVSLFTKVRLTDTLRYIADFFPPDITQLFKQCFTTMYLVWDGNFYEQTDGITMGSSLSSVAANLFMKRFESLAIETAVDKPTVWRRYVNDTFVVWPHGRDKLDRFFKHLNGIHPNIQLPMEVEHNGVLPFLDVFVKNDLASATTSVFRKPTHTDRYLHNNSNQHPRQKNTVVRMLFEPGRRACSEELLQKELDHLRQAVRCNG
ncbi:hypothetical protein Trydic_g7996 [Trypoxylus dichotomus]